MRLLPRIAAATALLVAAACGSDGVRTGAGPATTGAREGTDVAGDLPRPPRVTVTGGGVDLSLDAWSWCWRTACVDGVPPADPPQAGDAPELVVSFPEPGWRFDARFSGAAAAGPCGDEEPGALERIGPTSFRLVPLGEPGDRVVTLSGRGGGDLLASFRWTTSTTGPFTPPRARLSVVANHDGAPDSYGVEMVVSHLARPPAAAAAGVVVTAEGGASRRIDLRPVDDPACRSARTVRLDAPLDEGRRAAGLGTPPFVYDVTLVIDGVTHTARATWPDDEDAECSPCVPLAFDPPLPARGPG